MLVFLTIKCTNHYALPCCIISALLDWMVKLLYTQHQSIM